MLRAREKSQTIAKLLAPLLAALVLWTILPASEAGAGLSGVGRVDPGTGFPGWMEDEGGLRLEPCLSGPNCSTPTPDEDRSPLTPGNIGSRVPYWSASATVPTSRGGSASLLLTTVGGFLPNEVPADGAQQVMNRIQIRADNLKPGATYEVTHPYGVETFTSVAGGPKGIDFTEDVGCLQAPCDDFATALNGRIGPWLVWDPSAGRPPAGHIGDPNVPHEVVGSPITDTDGVPQDYFKIEGPNVGGPGENVVRTNLFSVEGKVSGPTAFASPGGGRYGASQTISLTASDPRANVFYTTDGTVPTRQSTPYTEPFRVEETTMVKFLALGPADTTGERPRSPVLEQTYEIGSR
jgi:hypothetical protein